MAIRKEQIKGWGADLDPANRPAVPKEKTPVDGTGAHWKVIDQQLSGVEVFRSVERPHMTSVYGTSCPPRGLSGVIRRFAYKFGEERMHRWLPLLLADRIDVVEGLIADLRRGYIPNIFAEMGWKSELKYNRKGVYKKAAIAMGIMTGGILLMRRNRKIRVWAP